MKVVGILLTLLVAAFVLFLTFRNVQNGIHGGTATGLEKPIEKAKDVQRQIDLAAVRLAVQNYQVQQGRYPGDLSELVSAGLLTASQIEKLDYDPVTGNVVPHPE